MNKLQYFDCGTETITFQSSISAVRGSPEIQTCKSVFKNIQLFDLNRQTLFLIDLGTLNTTRCWCNFGTFLEDH